MTIRSTKSPKAASGKVAECSTAPRKFAKVIEAFSQDRDVRLDPGNGFGSGTLKANGKIFAMLASGNQFVVKLPKDRVDALVSSGDGRRFEPQRGKLMKEWLVVESERANWIGLAKQACDFVKRGTLGR